MTADPEGLVRLYTLSSQPPSLSESSLVVDQIWNEVSHQWVGGVAAIVSSNVFLLSFIVPSSFMDFCLDMMDQQGSKNISKIFIE